MELSQLRYFLTVAGCQNVSAAAKTLYISQPTLSQSISRLENDLGFELFERRKGKIRLSLAGHVFQSHIEHLFINLEQGIKLAREFSNKGPGDITIATSVGGIFEDIIPDYLVKHPTLNLHIYSESNSTISERIIDGKLDFAVATTWTPTQDIEYEIVFGEALYLLLSKKHPLARASSVSLKDLKNERFTVLNSVNDVDIATHICHTHGLFHPNIMLETSEPHLAIGHLRAGISVMLCFPENIRYMGELIDPDEFLLHRLSDQHYQRVFALLRRSGREFGETIRELYDLTKKKLDEINWLAQESIAGFEPRSQPTVLR